VFYQSEYLAAVNVFYRSVLTSLTTFCLGRVCSVKAAMSCQEGNVICISYMPALCRVTHSGRTRTRHVARIAGRIRRDVSGFTGEAFYVTGTDGFGSPLRACAREILRYKITSPIGLVG
jgi:hypothetical protein